MQGIWLPDALWEPYEPVDALKNWEVAGQNMEKLRLLREIS
jgi:hypothetical protein